VKPLPAIGITCYPSQGGSGIIATELGLNLARHGYTVHFITSSLPIRLRKYRENVFFHRVEMASYPVFEHPPYTLSLATAMAEVATCYELDILHVHYAIPHAASAYLAKQMVGPERLQVVTTLHGTDVTLVGQEPSFFPMTRFVIEQSDAVTAVSAFLKKETERVFDISRSIDVIPNFVDPRVFRPLTDTGRRARFADENEQLVVHASNFRRVKNVPAVIETFARIRQRVPSRLLLVGDGPEQAAIRRQVTELGEDEFVTFLGHVDELERILPLADLLLLPSFHESFGLVALEAMSCAVPVIATDRGGTNEFIDNGINGYLCDPEDVPGMAGAAIRLLTHPEHHAFVCQEAHRDAVEKYGSRCVLRQYLELYDRLIGLTEGDRAG